MVPENPFGRAQKTAPGDGEHSTPYGRRIKSVMTTACKKICPYAKRQRLGCGGGEPVLIMSRVRLERSAKRMLLAIDVGNTTITIGLFEGERLRATWRVATERRRLVDEYALTILGLLNAEGVGAEEIKDASLASVVPDLVPVFEALIRQRLGVKPLVVGTGTRTGIRILYDSPRDVGTDRVADVVGAVKLYGPPPLIVVDLGTALVFDAVSAEGDYLGGALAPGIHIAAEALSDRAAKLYPVELTRPASAIGKNTVSALQSGLLFGYVGLIEGMVVRFKRELGGQAKVVATGGWAELVARETPVIDVVDPDLTLHGLRLIYEANRE
jgi:type III pantothenate kinase